MSEKTPLYENAIDSLQHGVSHYLSRSSYNTAIKHAVLNIYHSIELLLKEKLASINPILIYSDINRKINNDSRTVGLGEIICRLENLGFPLSEEQINTLTDLQKSRNRIEHHHFNRSDNHELFVGKALKFIKIYLPSLYDDSLEDIINNEDNYRSLVEAIMSYEERVKSAIEEATRNASEVARCPVCEEETLGIGAYRGNYCFFCMSEIDVLECENCGEYVLPEDESFGSCENCLPERLRRF